MKNKKAYRIVALKSFSDVKEGDVGGYVGSYNNLSQDGNCWIYDDAIVFGPGTAVEDNATIRGNITITGKSKVYGNAKVSNNKLKNVLIDSSEIYENAEYSVNIVPKYNELLAYNGEGLVLAKIHGNAKVDASKIITAEIKDNVVMNDAYTHAVNVFSNTVIKEMGLASNGRFGNCPTLALKSKSDVLSPQTTSFANYKTSIEERYVWIDKSMTQPITTREEINELIDANKAREEEGHKAAEKARQDAKTNEAFADAIIDLLDRIREESGLTDIRADKEKSDEIRFNCYAFGGDDVDELFFKFSLNDSKVTGTMTVTTSEEYDHFWPYDSGPKSVKDRDGDYGFLYQFKLKVPTIKFEGGVEEAAYAFFEEIFSAPYLANEEVSEQYWAALDKLK